MEDRCSAEMLSQARTIHVMGVCGTGMGTFAGMLKARGAEVRGSDADGYPPMSDLLEAWGIPLMRGYKAENLDWGPDLVIVGNVIRATNPEAVALRERGIPHASFPEALSALFLASRHPVVITGTHGKTTTTSLTAWLLAHAGLDPGLLVGGVPSNFGVSFRLGKDAPFVVEGDEYDTAYFDKVPKFVHYRPRTAVITNIEFDHADIYPDVESIEREFTRFAGLLPADGRLMYWAGSERAARAAAAARCPTERYGGANGWWRAEKVRAGSEGTTFELYRGEDRLCEVRSPLFGDHNLQNTLAAMGVAIGLGVAPARAAEGVAAFTGVKKRHEIKGTAAGVTVIDDFAHHPTAVKATVRAVRARYPNGRLWCGFEVESNTSRRRVFQSEYPPAFEGAHAVLFCKPLAKADNLLPEERISLQEVCEALQERGVRAELIPEVDDMVRWLTPRLRAGDTVLGMSGRHFYGFHDKVLEALREAE